MPKYQTTVHMDMQLPEHDHCRYCGDPIRYGEEFCYDYCRELFIEQEKADKKKDIKFYAMIATTLGGLFIAGVLMKLYL